MASAILGLMIWGIVYTVKAQYLDFDPSSLQLPEAFTGHPLQACRARPGRRLRRQNRRRRRNPLSPSESSGEGPPARVMRALWVFHFPVYGGPHNTAVGVREPLADLGWKTVARSRTSPVTPSNA